MVAICFQTFYYQNCIHRVQKYAIQSQVQNHVNIIICLKSERFLKIHGKL